MFKNSLLLLSEKLFSRKYTYYLSYVNLKDILYWFNNIQATLTASIIFKNTLSTSYTVFIIPTNFDLTLPFQLMWFLSNTLNYYKFN